MRIAWLFFVVSCALLAAFSVAAIEEPKPPESPLPPQAKAVELQIYDVRELVKSTTDYPGPTVVWGSVYAAPFGNSASSVFQAADLVTLLHDRIFPRNFASPYTSIAEQNNCLVVMQTPEMHKKIRDYISKVRETVKPQVVVKTLLFAAPDIPANTLDGAAFAKLTTALPEGSVLCAPRVICYNKQRVYVRSGRSFNFIRDYDVAGSAYYPVVDTGYEGAVLEVCPTLDSDHRSADVDVRFTFTALNGKIETRNITLAPPLSSTLTLPMDMPMTDTQSLRTCLHVPLGKWVLAGAMNNTKPESKDKRLMLFVSIELAAKGVTPADK